MRLMMCEGVEHRISDRVCRKLLNMFDDRKATINMFGYYSIRVGSICISRNYGCARCPLRDPHKKVNGCTHLLRRIMGEQPFSHVHLFDDTIIWEPRFDTEVRQALYKIRTTLSSSKVI